MATATGGGPRRDSWLRIALPIGAAVAVVAALAAGWTVTRSTRVSSPSWPPAPAGGPFLPWPVAGNATEAERKRNRRVEIVVLTADTPGTVQETSKVAADESGAPPKESAMAVPVGANIPTPAVTGDPVSSLTDQTMDHKDTATPASQDRLSPADGADNPSSPTPLQ